MMNYSYALPCFKDADLAEGVKKLLGLPLCIVRFMDDPSGDDYALALTGGGMNLAWEICEAYLRLGYCPPVYFCDLPRMSGRGASKHDRDIVEACKEGLRHTAESATRTLTRLDDLVLDARRTRRRHA